MYEQFYGLSEKPFSIQPDPDFLFFSLRHSMAYAMLEYGIQNRAGFSVICGEIGCGKTTLVRHLLNNIGDQLHVGIVYNTHKHIDDLLGWIMLAFGQPYEGKSEIALFDAFQQFLINSYAEGKKSSIDCR
jgi:type II secretory pathway predicted ATPase ExeA